MTTRSGFHAARRLLAAVLSVWSATGASSAAAAETMMKVATPSGAALTRYQQSDFTWGVKYQPFQLGNAYQQWLYDTNAKTIRSADGWCLSTSAEFFPGLGRPVVVLTRCASGDALQQWDHDASNVLFNVRHQICLDADLASGSVVQVYWCSRVAPGANQQWLITPLLAGYFIQITDQGYAKCLDLDNARNEPGTNVGLWGCDANLPQHRWVYDVADGGIKYALNPGLCVDTPEAGESAGGLVSTWSCGGANGGPNPNQQFDLIAPEIGNGYTKAQLQLRNTKWCLQPQGNNAIVMAKCVPYAANQLFYLGTQLPATPGKCPTVECKNGGLCANGACQCKDGWGDATCGTKTDALVGLETSDGFLLTVAGDAARGLTYDVPQSTQKTQQFLFNALTKRLRVDERMFCVDGATADASLAACASAATQQWVYDVTKGTVQRSGADVCLEAAAGGRVQTSACAPATKPGQVWLVDQNIFSGDKLIRHRSSLSSCLTVDNGTLAVKPCDLKHRVWRHDAVAGEAPLRVGAQCVRAVQRSANAGTLAMASCDALADRNFEYDTATGLVRAFQTTLCVSLSGASALALATCDAKDAAQRWYIARRDQCTDPDFLANMNQCGASEQRGQCAFSGCQCAPGYSGKRCEYETCGATQCSNGGTCAKGKCTCPDGFAGAFCDDFVKCVGVACRNGGVCNDAGSCTCPVGFSGDRCTVRHPKVLLRTLAYRAIGVDGGRVVVVEPNARNKDHVWWWDSARNMLRSVGRPTYCLERSATGDAVLGTCDLAAPPQQQWRYETSSGRLRTGDQRGAVRFEQLAAGLLRVVVLEDATSSAGAASNATVLPDFRVDVDRLDLPGAPVRDDSGNCLTAPKGGAGALAFRTCDPNDDAQQWEYAPQSGLVRAALLDGFVCLAVDGASVSAQRCNGDAAAQKFRYDWSTQRFRHRGSRQCVSAAGPSVTACERAAPMRVFFRSFCDVVQLCGYGECAFERCVCPTGLGGPFCAQQAE